MSRSSSVVIVSPSLADANNGNWRTAQRWQQLLGTHRPVRITREWPDADAGTDGVMLALHARRSAAAVHAWSGAHPGRALGVVLTGTDLYQDLASSEEARRSVALAQRLVVLQERGVDALQAPLRAKARVIYQSGPGCPPVEKPRDVLEAVAVGHLRPAKTPQTLFEAAGLLREQADIHFTHIGDARGEPLLARQATDTQRDCPAYSWLGPLPHEATLQRIRAAHVLVHTSAMEGGAHVILEAVRCGTPVLASRVDGNVGMLGAGYEGYFPHGDAAALAGLLRDCRRGQGVEDPARDRLARLAAQCALRAPLFEPEAERRALLNLVQELETLP